MGPFTYMINGLVVRSDFPLSFPTCCSSSKSIPDVIIARKDEGVNVGTLQKCSPILSIRSDGLAKFEVAGVGVIVVFGGRYIAVTPATAQAEDDLQCILFGSVWAFLCHQRGLLPLKGSCFLGPKGAAAVLGPSGLGKSAICFGLSRLGYKSLCDDVVVLSMEQTIRVLPTCDEHKLWQDTLEDLKIPYGGLRPTRGGQRRFYVKAHGEYCEQKPIELTHLLFLERGNSRRMTTYEMSTRDAAVAVYNSIYHVGSVPGLVGVNERNAVHVARSIRLTKIRRGLVGSLKPDIDAINAMVSQ